jgi:hypothetical protein
VKKGRIIPMARNIAPRTSFLIKSLLFIIFYIFAL